jgi:hypothetical protein
MREEDMDMGQPSMEIDVEIDQAEGDDEANFQEMAPKGRFTAKALNNSGQSHQSFVAIV